MKKNKSRAGQSGVQPPLISNNKRATNSSQVPQTEVYDINSQSTRNRLPIMIGNINGNV